MCDIPSLRHYRQEIIDVIRRNVCTPSALVGFFALDGGRLSIKKQVDFARGHQTRKVMQDSPPLEPSPVPEGRVPRISRLMALATRFDRLIKEGEIGDQADLERLGHVTRARVTQIMNLLHLAPEIQEALLFLPRTVKGRDPIRECHIRPIADEIDWWRQREMLQRWAGKQS